MRGPRGLGRFSMALVTVLMGVGVAGCGDSDDESPETRASSGRTAEHVAAAETAITRDYKGTDRALPRSGPAAVPGREVWVVACSLASPGCSGPAEGVREAGRSLGWETKIVEGNDPGGAAGRIRSATSAGAHAIVLVATDCAWAPGPLAAAKKAGVKVYGIYAVDCEPGLFDGEIQYGNGGYREFVAAELGPAIANYVIAKTRGDAKILHLVSTEEEGLLKTLGDSFAATIEKRCPDCEITPVNFTEQDIAGNRIQTKTTTALNQHPDANVVFPGSDGAILLGVGGAVRSAEASGREVLLTGLEGFEPNLEMIADGGPQDFAAGFPARWTGWAAADGLNRVFAGEPQVDAGIGYQAIDSDHPPPSVPYDGNKRSLGYDENYKRIWSGSR